MLTFLNISAPLLASRRAISCGVVTMTAPGKFSSHCKTSSTSRLCVYCKLQLTLSAFVNQWWRWDYPSSTVLTFNVLIYLRTQTDKCKQEDIWNTHRGVSLVVLQGIYLTDTQMHTQTPGQTPVTGTDCEMDNWVSPVPGGMSITRTSMSPQATCRSNLSTADITYNIIKWD